MRTIILWLMSASIVMAAVSSGSRGAKKENTVPGTPVKQVELLRDVSLSIDVDCLSTPAHAYVRFENNSKVPLWFPISDIPAYKQDKKTKTLWIWLGYFKKPHGEFRMHYVVPHMQKVDPGKTYRAELAWSELAQLIAKGGLTMRMQARVATKAFVFTDIRGDQPLEDYIRNSIVVKSAVIVSK